jgi:hypothetical protein
LCGSSQSAVTLDGPRIQCIHRNPTRKENTVKIAKHMEAVFVVALAAAGSFSYFADSVPQAHARPAVIQDSSIATETKMAVVVVKGKRPSAAEKQQMLLADRRAPGSVL